MIEYLTFGGICVIGYVIGMILKRVSNIEKRLIFEFSHKYTEEELKAIKSGDLE
ncbi:MAG: hypothetical protein NT076_03075 [Candidatus Pacearchaeota archaeon]|nr:hypothetical protein [Candidatus Pacearchaeota archaeon]